jgi:membrane protein required for colicin V production
VGAIDRALGFVFGALRGLLLVVIAVLFFDWLVQIPPGWVANAQSRPMLETLGAKLMAALPDDIEAALNRRRGGGGDGETSGSDASRTPDEEPADADPGPSRAAREGLNRLIENSDN